jgi:putative membrane protein|tara:strand:- start:210 stop:1382 length:1173 start_codon:yes stop_codon:yes gene_type:complete
MMMMSTSRKKRTSISRRKKQSSKHTPILIICIDRDDDLGEKTNLKSPIIGSKNCENAGMKLAISDPEEADANAIFAAVKTYNELSRTGRKCEVAIVTGNHSGGFQSDEKMRKQIQSIVNKTKIVDAILVSDDSDESSIIPLVQDIISINSIQRIVIKHSGALEETYAVLGRYLKMLIFDQRYSKFALGIPGLLFLSWAFLALFNLLEQAITVTLAILGMAFVIRGFDLDRLTRSLPKLELTSYVRLFSSVAGSLVLIIGTFLGASSISQSISINEAFSSPSNLLSSAPELIGVFAVESLLLLWIGLGLFIAGDLLSNWIINKKRRVIRGVILLLTLVFLFLPIQQFAKLLIGMGDTFTFIASLIFGLAGSFISVIFLYQRYIRLPRSRRK